MRPARFLFALVFLTCGALAPPVPPAAGQQVLPALAGGAAGLAAGGYVAIGIVTTQARRGRYLYSTEDALGWHATPILVGPTVGFFIGLVDQERLRRTVIGGAVGGFVGMSAGAIVGQWIWDPPEGRWAGAVIGSAAGLLTGSLIGVLWPAPEEAPVPSTDRARLPIGVSLRF
jgi:hypothetical protein